MKSILEIYSVLNEASKGGERFIGEVFTDKVYDSCKPKLTVVDLGGFTGEFSFMCLPFAKEIYCVEPDPVPFAQLKKYVADFELEDRMKIFNFAITGHNGSCNMHLSHAGGSAVGGESPVQCKTLLTFLDENEIYHVDILKVDVEGSEKQIFEDPTFEKALKRIDLIIGEHAGFETLKNYDMTLKSSPWGVYLAKK